MSKSDLKRFLFNVQKKPTFKMTTIIMQFSSPDKDVTL